MLWNTYHGEKYAMEHTKMKCAVEHTNEKCVMENTKRKRVVEHTKVKCVVEPYQGEVCRGEKTGRVNIVQEEMQDSCKREDLMHQLYNMDSHQRVCLFCVRGTPPKGGDRRAEEGSCWLVVELEMRR